MGLTSECEAYVGRRLLVEPQYGYGWNAQVDTHAGAYPAVDVPPPFHLTVDRFFKVNGALIGGIGTVEEAGHSLNGLKVGFSSRHTVDRDFVSDPVTCNLTIGAEESESKDGWLLAVGPPGLAGFGRLVDDAF